MRTVTIFGGSGFIGRYIVQKYANRGDLIRVAVRNPMAANFLKPLGEVGQITPVQASILSKDQVARAIQGSDIVINLVGILFEKRSQTFQSVHVEGAQLVAEMAAKEGVSRLLHMSALGTDLNSKSRYAQTKAKGEEAVLKHFPNSTIMRPSVVFGPDDAFLNRFAEMAMFSPFLPLMGGGRTRFQPIYVGDVAEAYLKASLKKETQGKVYELGGPEVYTFKELMQYLLETIHRNRLLVSVPFCVAKLMGAFTQFLPNPPLTRDQVELLKSDSIVSSKALKAEDLRVRKHALEVIAPLYLARYGSKGLI